MICDRVKKIEKYNESNYIVRFTPEELGGLQKGHACFWEITKGGSPQLKLVFKFIQILNQKIDIDSIISMRICFKNFSIY